MIIKDNLSFVIPVYLKTIGDKVALSKTMEKILNIASDIIVISQGLKPHFNNKKINHYHSNSSLGKWNAVSYAKIFKVNDFIFIHDGDNPFKEESYKNILKFQRNTFIQRDQIILYAQDELSRESRKYIELFLNKYSTEDQGKCIDIQSGGVILERDIFQELNFSSFGDYGGELTIYNYLETHNIPVDTIDMEVEVDKSRQQSNYIIENILQSVIHAPLSMTRVLAILKICMDDCDRYIASNQKFKNEVLYFLRKYDLVY
jgi:hypothetical protein